MGGVRGVFGGLCVEGGAGGGETRGGGALMKRELHIESNDLPKLSAITRVDASGAGVPCSEGFRR